MRCKYCGQPGGFLNPVMSNGYHTQCFETKIRRETNAKKPPGNTPYDEFKRQMDEAAEEQRREREERQKRKTWDFGRRYGFDFDPQSDFFHGFTYAHETTDRGANDFGKWFNERFKRAWSEEERRMYEDAHEGGQSRTSWDGAQYERTRKQVAGVTVVVDKKRLKQLFFLCHPDKHENSERSLEVTRWLGEIKSQMEGK